MGRKQAAKGARVEEILRRYFLEQGYFVVRGLKCRYGGADVTDVDLWLYQRPSALVRERVVVDAKGGVRPKAMERILWAVGVRNLVGADRCIVATTDQRREVKDFGAKGDVLVLDGRVLSRLANRYSGAEGRLTEEEFALEVFPRGDARLLGDWRARLDSSKGRLLEDVGFDACNAWLLDARYFLEAARRGMPRAASALRLAYLSIAFFLIGLDWVTRRTAFEEKDARAADLEAGLRFGTKGREGFDRLLGTVEALLARFYPEMSGRGAALRNRAMEELRDLPAGGLAQFLAKGEIYSKLFVIARAFESSAFGSSLNGPAELDVPVQAVFGAVLDFCGVPREGFLGTQAEPTGEVSRQAET